jgi:hypothetical protein
VSSLNFSAVVFGSPLVFAGPRDFESDDTLFPILREVGQSTTCFVNDDDIIPRALATNFPANFQARIKNYPDDRYVCFRIFCLLRTINSAFIGFVSAWFSVQAVRPNYRGVGRLVLLRNNLACLLPWTDQVLQISNLSIRDPIDYWDDRCNCLNKFVHDHKAISYAKAIAAATGGAPYRSQPWRMDINASSMAEQ